MGIQASWSHPRTIVHADMVTLCQLSVQECCLLGWIIVPSCVESGSERWGGSGHAGCSFQNKKSLGFHVHLPLCENISIHLKKFCRSWGVSVCYCRHCNVLYIDVLKYLTSFNTTQDFNSCSGPVLVCYSISTWNAEFATFWEVVMA